MSVLYQRLSLTIQRYLSAVTTDALLRRALLDVGVTADQLSDAHLAAIAPHLERGIRLFVSFDRQEQLRKELLQVTVGAGEPKPLPPAQTIPVRVEHDISEARMAARGLCARMGARALTVQKVATIVSELARNIVSYTSGGSIELAIIDSTPRRMRIRANDSGAGIADLEVILSGRYRSKTGMGKGILGVKRLADSFDIQTGPGGTHIQAELSL